MGSQTLDILRQGIWASLTGGWYYDPYQTIFCNTFHLYLWLLLFCFPLILYFYVTIQSIYIWVGYVFIISITIGIIKYMNLKLHKLFDTTECILEDNNMNNLQTNSTTCNIENNNTREVVQEVIELEDMKTTTEEHNEDEKNYPSKSSTSTNYKVDVHRKNSTSNSSNSEYSETNGKINAKVDSTDNESKIDNVISPGTSEEFCTNNNNNVGTNGNICEKNRSVCERNERSIRKNEQRSNSIDVFFSNQQQSDYLRTIPSTSTSSAFELSSPPLNNNQQEKGLMFWNTNNQWERDQSISGNIDSNITNEQGTNCSVVKAKRNHHLNKDKTNLDLDFTFNCNLNKKMNKFNQSEIVYPIVEKNENHVKSSGRFQVHTHGDEDENKDDSDIDEDDESKSHLIRKRGITSISMCSVDRQSSFSQKSLKLRKQDSINSKESKYSFDSIDKPSKSDKQSISFDLSSFDSVDDTSSINKSPKESPNPSMYCHISIQNSQKESSNPSLSAKSPDGSIPSIDLTCNQKEGSNISLNSDNKDNFEQKQSSPSVQFVDEKETESSLSTSLSKSLGEIDSRMKLETESIEEIDKNGQNKIGQSKSQNASQESVKILKDNQQSKEKLNSSIDFELDWLFEHTDSENEKMKEKIRHEVQEENASYSVNKIEEIVASTEACLKRSGSKVRRNGADDDEEDEPNRRDMSVLNLKRKKRNRRERRPFCRRSIHTLPNNSNFPGPSNSNVRKPDFQVMYVGGGNKSGKKSLETSFTLHETFYKNSQQSEDDYDDDADEDVYVRSKSTNSADNSSTANNNISHKEMLQIFLATRQTKANDDEVFTFKNEEERGSVTSGLGSCISTSPVAIHHDMGDTYNKIERHRNGRHSRTSRRHPGRVKHLSSRTPRRNPLIRHNSQQQSQQTNSSSLHVAVPSGTHLAVSHNDTTEGAVHIFRDENGELMSYMFDEKGLGLAQNVHTDTGSKILKVLIDQQQQPVPSTSQASQSTDQQTNDPLNHSSSSTSGENVYATLIPPNLVAANAALTQRSRNSYTNLLPSDYPNTSRSRNTDDVYTSLLLPESSNSTIAQRARNSNDIYLPIVPPNSAAANAPITQITQNSNGSYVVETLLPHSKLLRHMNIDCNRVILSENSPTHILQNDLELVNVIRNRFHFMDFIETPSQQQQQEPKRYYQFPIFPFANVKIHFNRLMLLSLLDHNITLFYTLLCLFLTVLVAVFGSWLLYLNFYKDIHVFIFCFVIAGCQYSMLKSVQPDSSSPTHGFNKIIIFSRAFYFIIISSLVLILHYSVLYKKEWSNFSVYNIQCHPKEIINSSKDVLVSFLLYFPLIFSFGLFPQVNTFLMYFLEQIDIYIFGGTATCSVISSVYCIFRSMLSVLLLYGFAYAGLSEPKSSQHILFSIYCGLVVSTSYHLSRCSSDPLPIWNIIKKYLCPIDDEEVQQLQEKKVKNQIKKVSKKERKTSSISRHDENLKEDKNHENVLPVEHELHDPLPMKLILTVNARLKSDLIICTLVCIFVFGIHCSTVFSALQPELNFILWLIAITIGILLHYIFPHLRKQLPWLCVSRPVLRANEYNKFEVKNPAKIMLFEKFYVYLCFIERNIVYPVLFIASITSDAPRIISKFGLLGGSLILTICALKCLRSSFSDPSGQYLILCFSVLFFHFDFEGKISETFLLDYCVTSIIFCKSYEFLLKIQFVVTYIAPWQITWGSAFHAFAQPFSVPHSAMMFLQAFISAVLSSPLYPFLGSAIFLTSYPRPVKFWERDYNTRRSDHSNTRLVTQLDRTSGSDDNNLNSIFYEHLTRSLQHSLCGDLLLGRWGSVSQGDCFVLASDYLNCLIHIVEMGNGLVTFQMRGLEFRGTYCQQREVEAISESVEDNEGCCCCEPGHLPNLLSLNAAFSQRWLAWEVTTTKYVLEGYSISDNPAASMLQVFDFRKVLISYYVRSIIYYVSNAAKLEEWLNSPTIIAALQPTLDRSFVDLDPVFNVAIDEDYDFRSSGITRASFCSNYLDWIQYCAEKRKSLTIEKSKDSFFVTLCFALSLLGRRTLGAASHNTVSSVEFFLYGLHALFKGDFRITCERDEWVFTDMDLLKKVVAPAVKMSLKLHQEHFTEPDDYENPSALYSAITQHHEKLVISHEGDPTWRNAVLSGTQSLLALRHVLDDGVDEYKVIMLNKRYLSFRIIKMNRECVRGLWAGQQQELVYLRNRNPERGSIQNAKQALRNIINSSCDQPIGYPIFVSPLTTSYAETNEQLSSIVGGSLSVGVVKRAIMRFWRRIQRRCIEGCSSGGNVAHEDGGFGHDGVFQMTTFNIHAGYPGSHSIESNAMSGGGSISRGNRSSLASIGKPSSSTLASLAGLLSSNPSESSKHSNPSTTTLPSSTYDNISTNPNESKENADVTNYERARIIDPYQVHDALNLGRRIDVLWPDEKMRARGGRSFWKDWLPLIGMEGPVVHKWIPNHRDPNKRSNVDRTILLIKIDDKYVPISESGVQKLLPDGVEPG